MISPNRRLQRIVTSLLAAFAALSLAAQEQPPADQVRQLRLAGELEAAHELALRALATDAGEEVTVHLHLELARIADRVGLHRNSRPVASATEHVERAAAANRTANDELIAAVELARAEIAYRQEMASREFVRTRQHAELALTMFTVAGDGHGMAEAVHRLGLIALQRRELEPARVLFDESLRLDQSAGERPFFRGEYERHIAFVELFAENPAAALPHLQQSLAARREAGAIDASIFAAATLASTLLDLELLEDVQPVIEYGQEVASRIATPRGRAQIGLIAGRYHSLKGNAEAAREAFELARANAIEVGLEAMAEQASSGLTALLSCEPSC